jgi:hypothetical protein
MGELTEVSENFSLAVGTIPVWAWSLLWFVDPQANPLFSPVCSSHLWPVGNRLLQIARDPLRLAARDPLGLAWGKSWRPTLLYFTLDFACTTSEESLLFQKQKK